MREIILVKPRLKINSLKSKDISFVEDVGSNIIKFDSQHEEQSS